MSYEFKKLSEVEALTEVPEGANMIAEVGGQIKRVPSVTGEGGGSGGGVKTAIIKASNYDSVLDWMSGKTSTHPDYKNVTFSCTNMTYHEVYSSIFAGEQVNIVCMFAPEGPVIQDVSFVAMMDGIAMDVLFSSMGTTTHYKSLIWRESGISVAE